MTIEINQESIVFQTQMQAAKAAMGKDLITKIDDTGTYVYIGKAAAGSLTSAAVWKIKRISSTDILFAGGAATFNQIWDNHATITLYA